MTVPATGTLTYNGVTFNALTRTKLSGRPVPTSDRRSVAFMEWTLDVEAYVNENGAGSTDTNLASVRKALSKPGGKLSYKNKGFGDLVINDGSDTANANVRDAQWGPWPEMITWTPVGNNQTAFVTWKCTTRIPECTGALYQSEPLEVSYTVETDIDIDGYTTIKISGHLTIPMTRMNVSAQNLMDHCDKSRSKIKPPLIPGFQRTQQTFQSSEDKRTISFVFVDKEIPVPFPEQVTQANIKHKVSTSLLKQGFGINWSGSISGNIILAAGVPKAFAFTKFLIIVNGRLKLSRNPKALAVVRNTQKGQIVVKSFEIEDDVFGRGSYFAITYDIIGTTLKSILEISGLFRPVPGTSFDKWQTSLERSAFHERGHAKLGQDLNDDLLIDLCLANHHPHVSPGKVLIEEVGKDIQAEEDKKPEIDNDDSWLYWHCEVLTSEDDKLIIHKPLAGQKEGVPGPDFGVFNVINKALQGEKPAEMENVKNIHQQPIAPTFRVRLVGKAMRIGKPITPPEITNFGGIPFNNGKRIIKKANLGGAYAALGLHVNGMTWDIEYILERAPAAPIQAPASPFLKNDSPKQGQN